MEIKKTLFIVLGIFLLGAFLRFFKLPENLLFDAEQATNYLEIREIITTRHFPLSGPPAAHLFGLGPLYYWLMIPLMVMFNFDPRIGTFLVVATGSLMIPLNYWVVTRVFNRRVAVLSSLAIALSPFLIEFSRLGRFYFLALIPFYFLFYFLFRVWQGQGKFLFWAGLSFGLILQFHLAPLFFLPTILLVLWVKRTGFTKKNLLFGLFGFFLTSLPFLMADFVNRFEITIRLLTWIPYRVAGFLGFYPKNNFSVETLEQNMRLIFNFVSENFVLKQEGLGLAIAAAIAGFMILNFRKALQAKKPEDFGWFFVFWSFTISLLVLFIHGLPPEHYFLTLAPVLIIIFSLLINKLYCCRSCLVLLVSFFPLLLFLNFGTFNSSAVFYGSCHENLSCFQFQEEIAKAIINDANGETFELQRVGEFDYYPEGYKQNYQYLVWWLGNRQAVKGASLRYTIYEDPARVPAIAEEAVQVYKKSRVLVLKEKNNK